jgi:excisionase family DNA binding protein
MDEVLKSLSSSKTVDERGQGVAMVDPTDDPGVAMSIADVARVTTLNRCTVYAELRAGRLRSFKVGRRRLVSRRALDDWVNAREDEQRGMAS